MLLSRKKIETVFAKWNQAWNDHDLDRVMALFHEELWQLPAAMVFNGLWLTIVGVGIFLSGRRRRLPTPSATT